MRICQKRRDLRSPDAQKSSDSKITRQSFQAVDRQWIADTAVIDRADWSGSTGEGKLSAQARAASFCRQATATRMVS